MILVLNSRSSANRHRRTLARGTVGLLAGRCPNPCWGSEQQQRDVVQRLPICMIEYVQETDLDVCTAYWSDRGHVVAEGGQCFASRGGAIARRIVVRVRLRGVARRSASRPTSPGPRLVAARAAARQFELVLRRDSTHPNDLWQADHTDLDVRCSMRTAGPESIWVLTSITRARSFALT